MIALLAKELRAHLLVGLASVALGLAMVLILLFHAIDLESPSYLPTGAMFANLAIPVLSIIWARRLFVLEHRQGTYELLASLPLQPAAIVVVKIVVALLLVLVVAEGGGLLVAFVAGQREIVGVARLARLTVAIGALAYAWVGLAVAFAQLGRHRLAAWVVLAAALGVLVSHPVTERLVGLGAIDTGATVLASPFGQRQLAAFVWGTVGIAFSIWIVTLRGGATVRRFYEPGDGHQRALSMAFIMGAVSLLVLIATAIEERTEPNDLLPAVGDGGVRVAARLNTPLWKLAKDLDTELAAIANAIDGPRWPPVVVRARHDASKPGAMSHDLVGRTLHLAVDLRAAGHDQLLRRALREVLVASRGGWPAPQHADAWMIPGLADAWLESRGRPTDDVTLAAAYAGRTGVTTSTLTDWPRLRRRLGADLATGVSWVGLRVATKRCGVELPELIAFALPSGGPPSGAKRILGDGRDAACAADSFAEAWKSALDELAERVPRRALPNVELVRTPFDRAPVVIAVKLDEALPADAELWWSRIDPLEGVEPQLLDVRRRPLAGDVTITLDPRARIAATVAYRIPDTDAVVISGWVEVGFE